MTIILILYAVLSHIIASLISILMGGLACGATLTDYMYIWLYALVLWPIALIYFMWVMAMNRLTVRKTDSQKT
jgi:hypothetical protein